MKGQTLLWKTLLISLNGLYMGAIGALPVALGFWVYIPWQRLPYPPVYFVYSSVLLFGSDLLLLIALGADLGLRALTGTPEIHRPHPSLQFLIGLAAWATLSAAWSLEPRLSLYTGLHLLGISGLALSLSGRPSAWRPLSLGCFLGILLQTTLAALETMAQSTAFLKPLGLEWPGQLDPSVPGAAVIALPGSQRWLRAYGTLPHPNLLGLYLLGLAAAPAAWGLRGDRWAIIGRAGIGLAAMGLGMSFSRAAWLGFVVGLLWLLAAPRFPTGRRTALVLSGAGGLLTVVCAFAPQTVSRIAGNGSPLEARSILERQWLMEQALHQITAHPLLGIGAGTFPLALREGLPPGYRPEPVHHVGALIMAELGLPGTLLGLGMAGALLRSIRRGVSPEAWALAASLLGLLVVSMLDHPLWTLAPARALGGCLLGAWAGQLQANGGSALRLPPRH
ncbi:O-antigen ligase family protein [Thermoflexus sp.]|uniref:O-antigen ligase family protein n=1 Tax=Thermoflexus sp. TaxID=1969742 RepID=UPI0035E43C16